MASIERPIVARETLSSRGGVQETLQLFLSPTGNAIISIGSAAWSPGDLAQVKELGNAILRCVAAIEAERDKK